MNPVNVAVGFIVILAIIVASIWSEGLLLPLLMPASVWAWQFAGVNAT